MTTVFERFYRAPGTPAGGLGLGLWLAKNIVELHGGKISVHNRPGSGAIFTIRLPIGQQPESPPEEAMAQTTKILIVDDEAAIRRLLRVSFKSQGLAVVEATTGKEGIEQAAMSHPDLIILDLGLPDIDGLKVLKSIREWSQVPVIVLTVRDSEIDKVALLDAGANDYITKPFGVAGAYWRAFEWP